MSDGSFGRQHCARDRAGWSKSQVYTHTLSPWASQDMVTCDDLHFRKLRGRCFPGMGSPMLRLWVLLQLFFQLNLSSERIHYSGHDVMDLFEQKGCCFPRWGMGEVVRGCTVNSLSSWQAPA